MWVALAGGAVAAIGLFALVLGVGQIGAAEALRLIEAVAPAARFLGTAVITASITVLALLLTLLGLSLNGHYSFRPAFYTRLGRITILAVVALVVSAAVLLATSLPINQVDGARELYGVYYYSLAAGISILAGIAIGLGLILGSTLRGLVRIGHPDGNSDLLADED